MPDIGGTVGQDVPVATVSAGQGVDPIADELPRSTESSTAILVQRLALALIAAALVLRLWVLLSGFFYWDDYIFMGRAARLPLFGQDYLLGAHDGHFMPGAFAVTWVVERLGRLNFTLPVAVMALAQAGVWWAWYRLLVRMFGRRLPILAPLALVLFSSLAMPSSVWWAAALNGIPMQLGLILVAHGLLTWRTGRHRAGVLLMSLATAGTLLFFEKGILLAPFAFGLAWVLDERRPLRTSLRRTLVDYRVLWAALFGITAVYVLAYLALVDKTPLAPNDWAAAADLVGRGFVLAVLPTLTGGPLLWQPVGYGSAIAVPPTWLVWVSAEVLLVLVVFTCWLRPRAARAWAFAGLYVAADLVLVVAGRLGPLVDPAVVQGLRYTADAIVPIALALGLALMPLVGESENPRARSVRRSVARHRTTSLIAAFVAVDLFVTLAVISQVGFRTIWRANESRAWITESADSLSNAASSAAMLNQDVPERVLYPLATPYNGTEWVLAPLAQRPPFSNSTTDLRLISEAGTLVDAVVEGPTALPGPVPGCGWRLSGGGGSIALSADIVYFDHTVRIGYLAGADTPARIRLGNEAAVEVTLTKGVNVVFVRLTGGGPTLTISGLAPGVTVCTDDVAIGQVVAAATP